MYEERGKTLPDGRIEVIVSDPSTGQEVLRYYSPGAEPKVNLGNLVLNGGFLRDELMPPSVAKKDDLRPLATKDELRTETSGLLARSEVMEGDKIKSSLLPVGNVTTADGSSLLASDGKIRRDLLPESTEGGSVNLNPLSERVAALENAPKVADKSQEVTALQGGISTLQGVVSEHATNIASNDRRITALESRPVPESVNLQPLENRVTALEGKASILGEDGKVKADLLPDSCKGEHCEAQPLPSDVVRTADIENVVRKSELFDTAHNMILPELIPEAEVAVKGLKGKGRPDKPGTTEGAIVGDEEDCTRYLSTDGAGTGAWEWEKRGGVWHVVRGDTGWRKIEDVGLETGSVLVRRNGVQVDVQFYGVSYRSTIRIKEWRDLTKDDWDSGLIAKIPEGFRGCANIVNPFYNASNYDFLGLFSVEKSKKSAEQVIVTRFKTSRAQDIRCGMFSFPTVDAWPSSLPGESFEAICPTT